MHLSHKIALANIKYRNIAGHIMRSSLKEFCITCCAIGLAMLFYANTSYASPNNSNQGSKSGKHHPQIITSFADIIEPLMPSVVNIYTVKYSPKNRENMQNGSEFFPFSQVNDFFEQFNVPFTFEDLYGNPRWTPLGSGLVIDDSGLIVTNHHVVAGSDEVNIKFHDNTELPAIVIGSDPKTDLALIKVDNKTPLSPAEFGDATAVRVGDVVIAIGNPLGYGGTVTTGIISSKGRDIGAGIDELVDDFIQTDAAINVGNSGGPLFNMDGEVIGINTAIPAAGGGTNIGIGFAIPSNTVSDIVSKLKENGKVSRGRLDINVQEVTEDLAEALGLDQSSGVLIVDAPQGGVGFNAGLRRGDVITSFNDQNVLNARKLKLFVADSDIGSKVKLGVMRSKKVVYFMVEIIDSDLASNIAPKVKKKEPAYFEIEGFKISNLSAFFINNFDIDPDISGVVVTDVMDDMTDIDIRMGDVIQSIDQTRIENIDQLASIYEKLKGGDKKSCLLLVRRGDFSLFVAIPLI